MTDLWWALGVGVASGVVYGGTVVLLNVLHGEKWNEGL
jgi:hypothetical protein